MNAEEILEALAGDQRLFSIPADELYGTTVLKLTVNHNITKSTSESRDAAETRTREMREQIDAGRQRIASLPSLAAMERELQTLRTRAERAEDREHRLNAWLKKILADEWYETSDSPELNGQCCFTVPNILQDLR